MTKDTEVPVTQMDQDAAEFFRYPLGWTSWSINQRADWANRLLIAFAHHRLAAIKATQSNSSAAGERAAIINYLWCEAGRDADTANTFEEETISRAFYGGACLALVQAAKAIETRGHLSSPDPDPVGTAVADETERCARVADMAAEEAGRLALTYPEESPSRDRLLALARDRGWTAAAIRARSSGESK